MARVPTVLVFTFAAAVALLAAGASAAPCIPCSMCMTDNCRSYCSESCPDEAPAQPNAQPAPSDVTVSVTQCIKKGAGYGTTAADKACRMTVTWCNGGRTLGAPAVAEAADAADATNVAQCSSAAMGACQRVALAKSPCAGMLQNGFNECSAEQAMAFWRGEVQSHCHEWAAQMTDVNPGTNAWRGGPSGEGQQQQQQQQEQPQDGAWTNAARRLLVAPPSRYPRAVRLSQLPRATVAAV